MVNASAVAEYFIAFSHEHGDPITNLKLQKLLYYAQAWHLALKDEPLFADRIEAWVHGPVVPSIYHRFKIYAWKPIDYDARYPELERDVKDHLDEVLEVYGSFSAYDLERLTHSEMPWQRARKGLADDDPCSEAITNDDMKSFYRSQVNG